jgi:hypothetical protein
MHKMMQDYWKIVSRSMAGMGLGGLHMMKCVAKMPQKQQQEGGSTPESLITPNILNVLHRILTVVMHAGVGN